MPHETADHKPQEQTWGAKHACDILVGIVGLLAIGGISIIPLIVDAYKGDAIDAGKAGLFGDFIGGYFGTIFLVISVVVLCISYRNQRATNERVVFESRFFELLKLHRENTSEVGIGKKSGRRVFVSMIREFRLSMAIVEMACKEVAPATPLKSKRDLAYMAFYYGVGPNSTRIFTDAVAYHPKPLVKKVAQLMEQKQEEYDDAATIEAFWIYADWGNDSLNGIKRLSYKPFDGHQSRLAHYFRHLYQTIKYIDKHAPNGTKLGYADVVRAQLTNHEQALLCINALSSIGSKWITEEYLMDYHMIKNLPERFFDPVTEWDIKKCFPEIDFEFLNNKSPVFGRDEDV